MNISKTYERINAPVVPSPRLMEKTLAKIRRSGFPRRRLAAIAAARPAGPEPSTMIS